VKILFATDVFPPKSGGSGWSTFHLARALAQRGHAVQVALPKQDIDGTQTRVYEGIDVVEVGYRASSAPGWRARQRPRAIEKTFGAYLAQHAHDFDVVHAQHVLSIAAAVAAKKIARVPVVSTVRDYWHVCLYGTLWRDNTICPICRGGAITRCLRQRYGGAAQFMLPFVPFVERELRRRQRALQASDAVIAVSHYVAGTLRGIVAEEKLRVVPNLIDAEETQQIADRRWQTTNSVKRGTSDARYLLFIGKLNVFKGADMLPEILTKSGASLPLIVAGDGELKDTLARAPGIELRGWVSNAESLQLLARADALLFPSRWAEPLARTLLEAQALGVPTVACNTGGTRDIIDNNLNGLLAGNVDEFAAQLRWLMEDAALRARLSENAKRSAREKFSPGAVAARFESVYESAICHLSFAVRH
jgi:glycogen(starch) synthase